MSKRFAAILTMAAAVASATVALMAAPAGAVSASPTALGACAELVASGPEQATTNTLNWAVLRNDCGEAIRGTVSLSHGDSPACVSIAAHGYNIVTWKGTGRAEYAVDCR
ncbi:hypothetical protein ACU635_59960 [[Actinomadura] parvosata]|uniref:hypothetical protein n=1 Tax=[Actinomadura] parvosata TaxID=1955412 RepID=UPI00406C1F38